MRVIKYEGEKHHEILCSWWRAHGWVPIPQTHLGYGIIIEDNDQPICAGFLYFTGTAFCVLEFIIASKSAAPVRRTAALDVLISTAKLLAASAGAKTVFMSVQHSRLIDKLKTHGFVASDTGMTNLISEV